MLMMYEELKLLAFVLVDENVELPDVPVEPVVIPPVESICEINDIAAEVVHDAVADDALVDHDTELLYPIP